MLILALKMNSWVPAKKKRVINQRGEDKEDGAGVSADRAVKVWRRGTAHSRCSESRGSKQDHLWSDGESGGAEDQGAVRTFVPAAPLPRRAPLHTLSKQGGDGDDRETLQVAVTNFLSHIFIKGGCMDDSLKCPRVLERSFRRTFYAKRRSSLNINKLPFSKGKHRGWGESKSQWTWTGVCKQKSKAG